MTLNEIENFIFQSTIDDWFYYSDADIFTFIKNISIQLRAKQTFGVERFVEPWIQVFPDQNAFQDFYILYYNSAPIKEYRFVSVDGGRISIPFPKSRNNLKITQEMYHLGLIINKGDSKEYNSYLRMAKIEIENK